MTGNLTEFLRCWTDSATRLPMMATTVPLGARGEREVGRPAEFDFPAERAFPVSVVAGHGLLAGTTLTLVLLTMLAN